MSGIDVRRLRPGDERVVERLATREPRTALLADPKTIFLVAFGDRAAVGFVLAYELPRRHGYETTLCIYEIEVSEAHRRRGIATRLLRELATLARGRGIAEAFVLTEPDNTAANRLYESVGGVAETCVQWDFDYTAS